MGVSSLHMICMLPNENHLEKLFHTMIEYLRIGAA
jgi:hypothetical protein